MGTKEEEVESRKGKNLKRLGNFEIGPTLCPSAVCSNPGGSGGGGGGRSLVRRNHALLYTTQPAE